MSSCKRCLYFLGSFQKSLFKVFFLMHNTCRMVQKHWATNDVHILIVTCDKTPYKNILDLCPNHQKILSRLFQLIFCIFSVIKTITHKNTNLCGHLTEDLCTDTPDQKVYYFVCLVRCPTINNRYYL